MGKTGRRKLGDHVMNKCHALPCARGEPVMTLVLTSSKALILPCQFGNSGVI